MLSSEYREPFELSTGSFEVDEWGDQHEAREVVYRGWCKAVNMSGSEYWAAHAQGMETTTKFYCRWSPVFEGMSTVGLTLTYRGRAFDVLAVDNVAGRNADCAIKAKERA